MSVVEVTASEAETKLSEILARAHGGEEFLVTKDGRPIARIVPAPAEATSDHGAVLDEIEAGRRSLAVEWRRRGIDGPAWAETKADIESMRARAPE